MKLHGHFRKFGNIKHAGLMGWRFVFREFLGFLLETHHAKLMPCLQKEKLY